MSRNSRNLADGSTGDRRDARHQQDETSLSLLERVAGRQIRIHGSNSLISISLSSESGSTATCHNKMLMT